MNPWRAASEGSWPNSLKDSSLGREEGNFALLQVSYSMAGSWPGWKVYEKEQKFLESPSMKSMTWPVSNHKDEPRG